MLRRLKCPVWDFTASGQHVELEATDDLLSLWGVAKALHVADVLELSLQPWELADSLAPVVDLDPVRVLVRESGKAITWKVPVEEAPGWGELVAALAAPGGGQAAGDEEDGEEEELWARASDISGGSTDAADIPGSGSSTSRRLRPRRRATVRPRRAPPRLRRRQQKSRPRSQQRQLQGPGGERGQSCRSGSVFCARTTTSSSPNVGSTLAAADSRGRCSVR